MPCLPVVNKPLRQCLCALGITLLAAACSTSVPITRYTLPTPDFTGGNVEAALSVAVADVQLPHYMVDSRIVSREAGAVIKLDAANRWAGIPEDMVTRALVQSLRSQGVDAWLRAGPQGVSAAAGVSVSFDEFFRDASGAAVLQGTYRLTGKQAVPGLQRFDIRVPPGTTASKDGYSSYAAATADGLQQLAARIRKSLLTLTGQS